MSDKHVAIIIPEPIIANSIADGGNVLLVLSALEKRQMLNADKEFSVSNLIPDLDGRIVAAIAPVVRQVVLPHADDPGKQAEHLALLALVPDSAVTHTAAQDGDWSVAATWANGVVPGTDANVLIPAGVTVRVDGVLAAIHRTIRVDGVLEFDTAVDTELMVDTIIVTPSGELTMGTAVQPVQDGVTARLVIADRGPIDPLWDPLRLSRGLISHGHTQMHGQAVTAIAEFMLPPSAGDQWLWVNGPMVGWKAGDTVIIPGVNPNVNEDEIRIIREVGISSIRVDPLDFDHRPPVSWARVYLAHLTRNVQIESQTDDLLRRGHVMFMHSQSVDIAYAEFVNLGRTNKKINLTDPVLDELGNIVPGTDLNPRGRYAVHFHRTGTGSGSAPAIVQGNVVTGSPGWGFVSHSSYVIMEDNVTFNVTGAGFVGEVGNEIGAMRRNMAIRSAGSGDTTDIRIFLPGPPSAAQPKTDDFGHDGTGFFLQGPGIIVEDNIAVGHRHAGFIFWLRSLREPGGPPQGVFKSVPSFPVANVIDQPEIVAMAVNGLVSGENVRLRSFKSNTVYACGSGLDVSRHMFQLEEYRKSYSVIDGFTAWNIGDYRDKNGRVRAPMDDGAMGGHLGISIRYSSHVRIQNAKLHSTTGGVAIINNNDAHSLRVEGSTIEGWDLGIRSARGGNITLSRNYLANNVNIEVSPPAVYGAYNTVIEGNTYGRGVLLKMNFDTRFKGPVFNAMSVLFSGRRVYFHQQAAAAVPFPVGSPAWIPAAHIGKTTQQIKDEFNLTVGGVLAPAGAIVMPGIDGLMER